jgi:hypothetical protein
MKILFASVLALGLAGAAVSTATPAAADVGFSIHVGDRHHGHHWRGYHHNGRYWHHRRHERWCRDWHWRHHHRYCRSWGWRWNYY